jgi:hypothetical protein
VIVSDAGKPFAIDELDNYATHKHPKVLAWLARHPRWTFHFTTSASWRNAVENFFSKMTRQRIRRGVFPASGPRGIRSDPVLGSSRPSLPADCAVEPDCAIWSRVDVVRSSARQHREGLYNHFAMSRGAGYRQRHCRYENNAQRDHWNPPAADRSSQLYRSACERGPPRRSTLNSRE